MKDEFAYVKDMTVDAYTKHLEIIRKRYSKAPVNRAKISSVEMTDAGTDPMATANTVAAIVKYATKNNLSYAEAKEMYKK